MGGSNRVVRVIIPKRTKTTERIDTSQADDIHRLNNTQSNLESTPTNQSHPHKHPPPNSSRSPHIEIQSIPHTRTIPKPPHRTTSLHIITCEHIWCTILPLLFDPSLQNNFSTSSSSSCSSCLTANWCAESLR